MTPEEWSDYHLAEIDRLEKLRRQAITQDQRDRIDKLIRIENDRWQNPTRNY